jgi:glycosyltransferase involved in cell wall biosynthesis
MSIKPGSRVSVAMCTFNGERFLREQLESILSQTRMPDEIVLCDDASGDGTLAIARGYETVLPLRIIANEHRLGATANFSRAIAECTGDIIFLCDQDDVWEALKVEKIMEIFSGPRRPGLVFSDATLIDEDSRRIGDSLWRKNRFPRTAKERFEHGGAFAHLLRSNIVTGATAAFRAEFKSVVLPVPQDWVHDYWIAAAIAAFAPLHCESAALTRYRIHSRQQIGVVPHIFGKVAKRLNAVNGLETERKKYAQLKTRVEMHRDIQIATADALRLLEQKLDHLAFRCALAVDAGNAKKLAAEILNGNYTRFSYGWVDIVADILSAARTRK